MFEKSFLRKGEGGKKEVREGGDLRRKGREGREGREERKRTGQCPSGWEEIFEIAYKE